MGSNSTRRSIEWTIPAGGGAQPGMDAATALQEWNGREPAQSEALIQPPASILDHLRLAKKSRKRTWEGSHHSHTFRGVAPNVHAALRAVAENEEHALDQVAQALLEFGLLCYQRGEILVEPVLSNQRRTLFPEETSKKGKLRWTEKTWGLKLPKKRSTKPKPGKTVKPWKDWPVVAYRLSNETFQQIVHICQDRLAARGEVVTKLLMHALDAYEVGRLVLEAEQKESPSETW